MTRSTIYGEIIAIGVIAGMRSMSAPALVSDLLSRAPAQSLAGSPFARLASPRVSTLLKLCAFGEMVVDKLPFTPSRIATGPLAGRIAAGAVSGAAFCVAKHQPAGVGAVLGGVGAIVGSYGFYWLRRWLGERTGAPDPILGLAEDALVVAGARTIFNLNNP